VSVRHEGRRPGYLIGNVVPFIRLPEQLAARVFSTNLPALHLVVQDDELVVVRKRYARKETNNREAGDQIRGGRMLGKI